MAWLKPELWSSRTITVNTTTQTQRYCNNYNARMIVSVSFPGAYTRRTGWVDDKKSIVYRGMYLCIEKSHVQWSRPNCRRLISFCFFFAFKFVKYRRCGVSGRVEACLRRSALVFLSLSTRPRTAATSDGRVKADDVADDFEWNRSLGSS